jgi:hypothetical protein
MCRRGVIWEKLPPLIITERHKSAFKRIILCLPPSSSLSLALPLFHPVAYFRDVPDQACSRTSSNYSLLGTDPKPDTGGRTYTKLHNVFSFPFSTHFSFIIPFPLLFYIIFPSLTYCSERYPNSFPLFPVRYTVVCRTNLMWPNYVLTSFSPISTGISPLLSKLSMFSAHKHIKFASTHWLWVLRPLSTGWFTDVSCFNSRWCRESFVLPTAVLLKFVLAVQHQEDVSDRELQR